MRPRRLDHLVFAVQDLAAATDAWEATFGLRAEPPAAPDHSAARDLLWGVACSVGHLDRTVTRLRVESNAVSDGGEGYAPGARVASLKPGVSHDVCTLFNHHEMARGPEGACG